MQKIDAIPSGKLKYFAVLFGAITIGLAVFAMITGGAFSVATLIYCLFPLASIAFCMVSDEKKAEVCQHKVGAIVLYVIFAVWAAYFVFGVISLLQLLSWITDFPLQWFIMLGQIACFFIALASGFLFYHGYRKEVLAAGSAPLLNSA